MEPIDDAFDALSHFNRYKWLDEDGESIIVTVPCGKITVRPARGGWKVAPLAKSPLGDYVAAGYLLCDGEDLIETVADASHGLARWRSFPA